MTLPINITLPLEERLITDNNPQTLYAYFKKLVYVLSTQMQQTNQTVNGTLTLINNATIPAYPFLTSTSPASPSTTTYSPSVIWIRRANLYTQIWFDIKWANNTDTGNLQVFVPFDSQPSTLQPYIGSIEADGITFTGGYTYLTANILPGTNTIEIHQSGSGQAVLPLPVSSSGHLRGSITYVGQQYT